VRTISDLQERESNGLAFEMAEAVLDLGTSPPATPKLPHRQLLAPAAAPAGAAAGAAAGVASGSDADAAGAAK
jgi:hypothetical protein